MQTVEVAHEHDGERLDVFLGEHVASRAWAQKLIDAGLVTVDGAPKAKRARVRAGQRVEWREPERPDTGPVEPASFTIVLEDEHLLVVDKPAGVVVHPSRGHEEGTLVQALAGRVAGGPDDTRPGVVHRLDRDTSGLLVLARDEATHARLQEMIRERSVVREYLALVLGRPAARTGTIDAPVGRDRRVRTRVSTDSDEPREAVTHFELQEALEKHTLLRVRLETGRTHHIRAHLLAIGHGVAGDREYGGAGDLGLGRQFLHAARLAFEHPATREPIDLTSPLPADLQAALAMARRGGA
jgi:23S rRNA pseudouridine1911/1915/1917 synthase